MPSRHAVEHDIAVARRRNETSIDRADAGSRSPPRVRDGLISDLDHAADAAACGAIGALVDRVRGAGDPYVLLARPI